MKNKEQGVGELYLHLIEQLKTEPNFVTDDGELKKWVVAESARDYSSDIIALLLKDNLLKEAFFVNVDGTEVFKLDKFLLFVEQKNFLDDGYTQFSQKVGLKIDGKFMNQHNEVELVFPHKDCVLEGGQTKEDHVRQEIFFNEVLAQDEITQLLEPKVLTAGKRYDTNGDHPLDGIMRDAEINEKRGLPKDTITDNLIIKGNNLLALHTIKKEFAGKVKLIYIDPPFNTGNDSFKYNDQFNHSTWMVFMRNRLMVAKELLASDGLIFIHIDDIEDAYLRVLADEVFGRKNFVNVIAVRSSTPSGTKTAHKDKTIIKQKDLISVYKGGDNVVLNPQYIKRKKWDTHYSWILDYHKDGSYSLRKLIDELISIGVFPEGQRLENIDIDSVEFKKYYLKHANEICCLQSHKNKDAEKKSRALVDKVYVDYVNGVVSGLYYNGRVITPLSHGIQKVYDNHIFTNDLGVLLCDFWDDIDFQNTQNEGGTSFPTAKKPEMLLYRIIDMCTKPGDIVMDFFLGSGTTAAVSHKTNRQYIGIEQLDYGNNDSVVRVRNVVKGDSSGISRAVQWRGGGSFVYLELKKYNQQFIDEIESAKNTDELLKIWVKMKQKAFFRFNTDMQKFDEDIEEFNAFPLERQKELLCNILDLNQLYINRSDMEDETAHVSEEEKRITKDFYQEA